MRSGRRRKSAEGAKTGAAVGANWPRLGTYWAYVGHSGGGDGNPLPVARRVAWGEILGRGGAAEVAAKQSGCGNFWIEGYFRALRIDSPQHSSD